MTFDVKTEYATYSNCILEVNRYANNDHIAISIFSLDEGPIAGLTVNIDGIERRDADCACVDVNNFPEAIRVIQELGIGKYLGYELVAGWCSYPVYEFDLNKIEEYEKE